MRDKLKEYEAVHEAVLFGILNEELEHGSIEQFYKNVVAATLGLSLEEFFDDPIFDEVSD